MGTYVIGDIHGCYDEWMEFKSRIEKQDPNAKFILVGDIVDRGNKVMEMIEWAMENITENGKYQMVCGNHEQDKIEWFADFLEYQRTFPDSDYRDFFPDNYDFKSTLSKHDCSQSYLQEIIHFFLELPVYKELYIDTGKSQKKQHYVIVHAYLPPDCINEDESVKKNALKYPENCDNIDQMYEISQRQSEVAWKRNFSGYNWLKSTIVLHGHTPTLEEDIFAIHPVKGRICYLKNDINLDCGLVYRMENSNLAAIRLEDLQEFYLYPVEEPDNKYDPIARITQKRIRQELLDLIHG